MGLIHAHYRPTTYWLSPVLSATQANPDLATPWAGWRQHRLADLGFAIETRLGNLVEIVRMFDRSVTVLAQQLLAEPDPGAWLGQAYQFDDDDALRRALVSGQAFIGESRSCFENLADFNSEFRRYFFGDPSLGKAASYAAIASLAKNDPWVEKLKDLRHEIMHSRALWLSFRLASLVQVEPVLVLEWRPELQAAASSISIDAMKAIRTGLETVVRAVAQDLALRAHSFRRKR